MVDDFEEGYLKRVMGLAQNLTESWSSSIVIAFYNYREFDHAHIVSKAKLSFVDSNFRDKVTVRSMTRGDYRRFEEVK